MWENLSYAPSGEEYAVNEGVGGCRSSLGGTKRRLRSATTKATATAIFEELRMMQLGTDEDEDG